MRALLLGALWLPSPLSGEIRRDPAGLNVNSQGATTLSITFGGLNNQVPVEALWCGQLIPADPDIGMKCDPATIYGSLPIRFDRSQQTLPNTFVDVMTIPPSVARRSYQAALRGVHPLFFYVRRFRNLAGGPDEYVFVTCRLTGGGARVPLSLTDVLLRFTMEEPVAVVRPGTRLPEFRAEISYTGTGTLKGRWEVVAPGEEPPSSRDLLTEATLPPTERGLQRRYRELVRFHLFLPPGPARHVLPGPDPASLPTQTEGLYQILLRIEASEDRDAASDLAAAGAGEGLVFSGAAAGFPLPTLRYYVGSGEAIRVSGFQMLAPASGARFQQNQPVDFLWSPASDAVLYRLEVTDKSGKEVLSALLQQGSTGYRAPPWIAEKAPDGLLRWRVHAIDAGGKEKRTTQWRELTIGK